MGGKTIAPSKKTLRVGSGDTLANALRRQRKTIRFVHIYREYNARADGLANEALDRRKNIRDSWDTYLP